VVLFDEIEKAHPDVMHILLQILEEGKLTDSLGRAVDFRNTIVIMTSNIGADLVRKGGGLGFGDPKPAADHEKLTQQMREEAKRVFRPELLNRIDDIIVFSQLQRFGARFPAGQGLRHRLRGAAAAARGGTLFGRSTGRGDPQRPYQHRRGGRGHRRT